MNRIVDPARDPSEGQGMGIVIDFPSRDAAYSSRRAVAAECRDNVTAQVVILPVIRIDRYEEQPGGLFRPGGGEHGRKRRRRASRS